MIIDTDTCDEAQAGMAFHALCRRFGWAGTVFSRDDVFDLASGGDADIELNDDLWNRIRTSEAWTETLVRRLNNEAWSVMDDAINDALDQIKAERDTPSEEVNA